MRYRARVDIEFDHDEVCTGCDCPNCDADMDSGVEEAKKFLDEMLEDLDILEFDVRDVDEA